MDILASRVLEVDGAPIFHLRLGRPVPEDDGQTWRCPYEIEGPLTKHRSSFCGIDPMQALLHAVRCLSLHAETSEENEAGRLTWLGEKGDFGFGNINPPPATVSPDVPAPPAPA